MTHDAGIDFPGYARKPAVQQLSISRFDPGRGAWAQADQGAGDASASELTCVTLNTWFQGPDHDLRYRGVLDALRGAGADVIMLQECTALLLEMLLAADWVRSRYAYARAPFRADAIPSHGLMLLSRLPLRSATLHPIPTNMGRSLLVAHARVNGAPFAFATTHLESMKAHADTRGEQLKAIFTVLEDAADAVLAGDFNFCSSWSDENSRLDSRYLDIWPAVAADDPGYTQDTARNPMLAAAKRETKRVRIDRILLRGRWRAASAQLVGTAPVDARHPKVFPSDHFGVSARLRA